MSLKTLSLKAKCSFAAAVLFVVGVCSAGTIAYISISRVLEDSLAVSVAAATKEGMDALEDIDSAHEHLRRIARPPAGRCRDDRAA